MEKKTADAYIPQVAADLQNLINMGFVHEMGHHGNDHEPKFEFIITVFVGLQVIEPVIRIFLHELIAVHTAVADCPVSDLRHKFIQAFSPLVPLHFCICDNKPLKHDLLMDRIRSDLLPSQKAGAIASMQEEGHVVAMIGDGVNDAPALKSADIGIAMGAMGSDIAVEAADVALMGDDVSKIPYLKWLSNAAVRTIRLSISLSLIINAIAIVLSLLGVLTPTTGALVHNAGSVFVVMIAALLYDRKFH